MKVFFYVNPLLTFLHSFNNLGRRLPNFLSEINENTFKSMNNVDLTVATQTASRGDSHP